MAGPKTIKKNIYKQRIFVIIICIAIFTAVACQVANGGIAILDEKLRLWVYSIRCPVLSDFFIPITRFGDKRTYIILAVILLVVPKTTKKFGIPFSLTAISSVSLYKFVKNCFKRPRPPVEMRLIKQGGFSFPSGHSLNCIVCVGLIIFLVRKYCPNRIIANVLTVLLSLLIILIGVSRVYVGVHYPTDIIGGWSLGMAFLIIVMMIIDRFDRS